MTGQRKYGQGCPVAHALDLVGDRWALLVVRELRLGPRRFGDLAGALPGIAPSVLTQRLADLVHVGVLQRLSLAGSTRPEGYGLTAWGADLEPVFVALARWGARSPVVPLEGPISDDAVMLGIRTFFPAASGTLAGAVTVAPGRSQAGADRTPSSVLVTLEHERYLLVLTDGSLTSLVRLTAGDPTPVPDAAVHSDADTLRALLVGSATPAEVLAVGSVGISGDETLARAVLDAMARRR